MLPAKRIQTTFAPISTSPDTIAHNDDLLTEILRRLPIKCLLRFKSVSKQWLFLISNPKFSALLNLTPKPPSALLLERHSGPFGPQYDFLNLNSSTSTSHPPFRSPNFIKTRPGVKISQSCNGLVLCENFTAIRTTGKDYYVCNPTTKQYSALPLIRFRTIFGIALAFDPSRSSHYKVICVGERDTLRRNYQIDVYSSKTGPWRPSGGPYPASDHIQFNHGVFWSGVVCWVSDVGDSLCFDVDEEILKPIPMPPVPDGWDKRRCKYFGEFGGHLHLVEIYCPDTGRFNVYEMKRDYSGWFVKYRVDLERVATAFPETLRSYVDPWHWYYNQFSVLCVVRGDADDADGDSFLVLHIPGIALRYNLKDKSFKELCDFVGGPCDWSPLRFRWLDAYQYTESLACV